MTPYFQAKGVTLFHGDCREVLPSLTWDVCLTDPPYAADVVERARGNARISRARFAGSAQNFGRGDVSRPLEAEYDGLAEEDLPSFSVQLARTPRWVGVFSCYEFSHPWRLALQATGLRYVRTGCWVKHGAAPQFTGDRPAQGFEPITLCHGSTIKLRWNGGGSHGVWTDAWEPAPNRAFPYFGQKPETLMRRLVRLFSDEGETVLDAFAGSGTTLVSALQLNRKAIGVELREESCELIAKRIERELSQGNLFQEQTA